MKQGLLLKLLGINIPVITLVILTLWVALDTLAADYFSVLMAEYHITPTDAHQMFVFTVHRYLIWASLAAMALAIGLSLLLTRRVLRPLTQMTETAGRISGGDYSSRVHSTSRDEIGQLAHAFNQMAMSLERVERLRRTMVSDVAHELRTPLTNIRGYIEALEDGVASPTHDTYDLLLEETMRLIHLVEDLLRLARADGARGDLSLQLVSIGELVARVLKSFDLQFREKRIAYDLNPGATGGVVLVDVEKMSQVIKNILRNAWQYTPEGGEVSIWVESAGRMVRTCFSNSGAGIAPEDLPHIFERFYRGEKSRSRDYGGTGIGLAIVKELVESQGGEVGVESSKGRTIFWITLPKGSIGHQSDSQPTHEGGNPTVIAKTC